MINRLFKTLGAIILAVGFATPSMAETSWVEPIERSWSLRLLGGAYRPNIDEQFDSANNPQALPYESFFGNQEPLMFTFGVERFLSTQFGGLSAGMTAGYWNVEGTLKSMDPDLETADTTELVLYPLSVEVSYYLDLFADGFPLVPYGRVGADYCIWEVLDGSGETATFSYANGENRSEYEAFGATKGWHYAFGVQLLLDNLDPSNADAFERDAGVKNTYIGIEYRKHQLDDFGSANSFRLGGQSVNVGLYIDL